MRMMVRKERIPFWSLRKVKFGFELVGEVLEEDGGHDIGTALRLYEILNKCSTRRESTLIGLYVISVKLLADNVVTYCYEKNFIKVYRTV